MLLNDATGILGVVKIGSACGRPYWNWLKRARIESPGEPFQYVSFITTRISDDAPVDAVIPLSPVLLSHEDSKDAIIRKAARKREGFLQDISRWFN